MAKQVDALAALRSLGALISPDLATGNITSRSCVLCGPQKDCDCASVEFGSPEYFARIDRAHGRKPR
jgi:hypothetical protein